MPARVGFLFNHEQPHQVAHSLPVALALAGRGADVEVVLASTSDRVSAEIERLAGAALPGSALRRLSLSRLSRAAAFALGPVAPAGKLLVYRDNLDFFRSLDVLVVTEKTSLVLKTHFDLGRLKIVHTRHGAGDRAIGFDRASARFDRVLVSGRKIADRLVAEAGVDPARIVTVGYPKFDVAGKGAAAPLFANGRPTVLYNPHVSPRLSSWYRMGRAVLGAFARSDAFNLVLAPHVMLFQRPVAISLDPPGLAFPGSVPTVYGKRANIIVDPGSAASVDMTYTDAADIYLGDASSQVYEFLRRPRPCVFLNPHRCAHKGRADFLHWGAGPVVEDVERLNDAIEESVAAHADRFAGVQRALFASTFDLTDRPSSERAADAILDLVGPERTPARG